jgi:hypothetical protein
VTANRNDPRDANNAPYRRAAARLARAMLALQEAVDGVFALDPEGYRPEPVEWEGRELPDYTWNIVPQEAGLLYHALRHAVSSVDCSLLGGIEGYVADVEAEEAAAGCDPCAVVAHNGR